MSRDAATANQAGKTGKSLGLRPRIGADGIARLARLVVAGDDPTEPAVVRSPLSGEPLGAVPRSSRRDLERALAAARVAQEEWAQRTVEERAGIFLRFHDLLITRQDDILDLIQLEAGKARKHAFEELGDVAIVCRYYALHAEDHLAPKRRKGALPGLTYTTEHRRPKGVVGIIAPWNYPLTLAISDSVPAFLAGNAVILKPDMLTPFSALWGLELLLEAGLPPNLFQIVVGEGTELGPPLIAGSDYLAFTGSTATGRTVARQAGDHLIGCSLELGGKNPMLVLADANLDAAVRGAVRGSFAGAGQLCISIERMYVHQTLYGRFLERFVEATRAQRLGASLDYENDIGSLVSPAQLAKVSTHVADAVAKGAKVETGGRARPDLGPYFYEPTILTGVTPEMTLFAEETFGPVVSVYPFEALNDAVEQANSGPYGLNSSIWSRDTELAERVAARLQFGTVNINDAYAAAWGSVDAPMGGFKDSGLGRRHGAEGILRFTESQNVAVQRGLPLAAPPGVTEEAYSKTLTGALRVLRHVPGLR